MRPSKTNKRLIILSKSSAHTVGGKLVFFYLIYYGVKIIARPMGIFFSAACDNFVIGDAAEA